MSSANATGRTGDGNGDGVLDSTQSDVQSVLLKFLGSAGTTNDSFVTMVVDSLNGKSNLGDGNFAQFTNLVQTNPSIGMPIGFQLPLVQLNLSATLSQSGIAETFSVYLDPKLGFNGYWAQDKSGVWVNLASVPFGGQIVTEGNKQRLDFSITDGGTFDADGLVNGVITQTGALASLQLSIVGVFSDPIPGSGFIL